jgi:perosamine synthetase
MEDAAEAFGSEYKGQKAGSIGDFGVFSFHGTKTITTGEGGMLVSNNKTLFEKASIIADHGRDPKVPKLFWCEKVGLKYKMSNLQAAIGLAQIERVEELVNHKRWVFKQYQSTLSSLGLQMNPEPKECINSYWMPTLLLPILTSIEQRDKVIEELIKVGIQARPFFYPVSSFPMMESISENTVSVNLSQRGINLPSYFDMDEDDIDYVVTHLTSLLTQITR